MQREESEAPLYMQGHDGYDDVESSDGEESPSQASIPSPTAQFSLRTQIDDFDGGPNAFGMGFDMSQEEITAHVENSITGSGGTGNLGPQEALPQNECIASNLAQHCHTCGTLYNLDTRCYQEIGAKLCKAFQQPDIDWTALQEACRCAQRLSSATNPNQIILLNQLIGMANMLQLSTSSAANSNQVALPQQSVPQVIGAADPPWQPAPPGVAWMQQSTPQPNAAAAPMLQPVPQFAGAVPPLQQWAPRTNEASAPMRQPIPQYTPAVAPTQEGSSKSNTTVMWKNIPGNYRQKDIIQHLEDKGFKGLFDFVYAPFDFERKAMKGFAFVNFVDNSRAELCMQFFKDFNQWKNKSEKKLEVIWPEGKGGQPPLQGLQANLKRYKNSDVMHKEIPEEFKPMTFNTTEQWRLGERMEFPTPDRPIKTPPYIHHVRAMVAERRTDPTVHKAAALSSPVRVPLPEPLEPPPEVTGGAFTEGM